MASVESLKASRKRWVRRLNHLRRVTHKARAAIKKRDKQIKTLSSQPYLTVHWALDQVGTVESPPFSNSGPKISQWIRDNGGLPGYPWCQYFADEAVFQGGGARIKSGYTPTVVQWARGGQYGLKIVHVEQPGDLVFFKFPGVSKDFCDHVGIALGDGRTVEGNTSPGAAGSQNNGGGVFIRRRPASQKVAIVRPS